MIKNRFAISAVIVIFSISLTLTAGAKSDDITLDITLSGCGVFTSITATVKADYPDQMPSYYVKLQEWSTEDINRFSAFSLVESRKNAKQIAVDDGVALLFDSNTYESMVFLANPASSWRYMNGRAEICYANALNGYYRQYTYSTNILAYLSETELLPVVDVAVDSLLEIGIQVGAPLQMTVYYPNDDNQFEDELISPDFVEIAFLRCWEGVDLSPWGKETADGRITCKSFITMFIDPQGISNILVPLVFEEIEERESLPIISLSEAIAFLEQHLSTLIYPDGLEAIVFNEIKLEYIPLPITSDYKEVTLVPVWNFYSNYYDDFLRESISINAYTGSIV